MNEMNSLEDPLRSWKPRRPSPALEARLFGRPTDREPAAARAGLVPGLAFASAAVCGALMWGLLLATQTHRPAAATMTGLSSTGLLASVCLSNAGVASENPNHRHSRQNAWFVTSFDWTNASQSPSTIGPLPAWKRSRL